MKSEQQIRKQVKKLWKDYQDIDWKQSELSFLNSIELNYKLDITLAKFEALNWVFEDEEENKK